MKVNLTGHVLSSLKKWDPAIPPGEQICVRKRYKANAPQLQIFYAVLVQKL